jgi:hypothetical protein
VTLDEYDLDAARSFVTPSGGLVRRMFWDPLSALGPSMTPSVWHRQASPTADGKRVAAAHAKRERKAAKRERDAALSAERREAARRAVEFFEDADTWAAMGLWDEAEFQSREFGDVPSWLTPSWRQRLNAKRARTNPLSCPCQRLDIENPGPHRSFCPWHARNIEATLAADPHAELPL